MVIFSFFDFPADQRTARRLLLAFCFLLGLLVGIGFAHRAGQPYFGVMREVVSSRASLPGLLASGMVPFLFSAFAVYVKRPALLIPIAFWKAFLFSYIGYGFLIAWGSAGWLVGGLMLFGSVCAMPLLYWYWLRYLDGRNFEVLPFCVILGTLAAIGFVNDRLIVPFLASIITF